MGNDKWLNYLTKFRFGYPTRFGMVGETGGTYPSDNEVTTAMSSFGQGIGVTQVQMLRAFSAISNNGVMLEPQFISKIYDPNSKTTRTSSTEVVGKPVSSEAASKTRDYMVTVGTDPYYGTLISGGVPIIQAGNESIAVKSGTAQIAENGAYLEGNNNTLNSVVAMVPSADPDFIMYVTIQQPQNWQAIFWQDVVNPILEQALLMKDTLMTSAAVETSGQTSYKLANVIGKDPGNTAEEMRRNLVHPIIIGTGSKITHVSKVGSI